MTEQKLGAVVFGTGVGLNTHVPALRGAGVEVRALVGRDLEKTNERAQWANIPLALNSMQPALALPDVDIVCVATPPHTHADIVLAACAAGKHVVCEKPFARDIAEAELMLAAAKNSRCVNAIGHELRFDVHHSLAAQAIREGLIGVPKMMTDILQLPMFAQANVEVPSWWSDINQGGGWLGAHAVHVFDLARFLLNSDLLGLSASTDTLSNHGWTAEDSYAIHFRTVSGAAGILQSSISDMGAPLIVTRIAGTKGALRIEGGQVYLSDAKGERKLEAGPELALFNSMSATKAFVKTSYDELCSSVDNIGAFTRLYQSVVETIRGNTVTHPSPFASFEDAVLGQRAMDAARASNANQGQWQSLIDKSGG